MRARVATLCCKVFGHDIGAGARACARCGADACAVLGHDLHPRARGTDPDAGKPWAMEWGRAPCMCSRCGYDDLLDPLIEDLKTMAA